jgi:hypothetical protein
VQSPLTSFFASLASFVCAFLSLSLSFLLRSRKTPKTTKIRFNSLPAHVLGRWQQRNACSQACPQRPGANTLPYRTGACHRRRSIEDPWKSPEARKGLKVLSCAPVFVFQSTRNSTSKGHTPQTAVPIAHQRIGIQQSVRAHPAVEILRARGCSGEARSSSTGAKGAGWAERGTLSGTVGGSARAQNGCRMSNVSLPCCHWYSASVLRSGQRVQWRPADLLEADVVSILAEATTADVQMVLADQTMRVVAHTAAQKTRTSQASSKQRTVSTRSA